MGKIRQLFYRFILFSFFPLLLSSPFLYAEEPPQSEIVEKVLAEEEEAHPQEGLTLEDFEKLRDGDVLIKTGYHAPGVPDEIGSQIAAIVYLKSEIEYVWQILSDWRSYEHIIPNVKEIKLIEQEDNRVLLYFNVSISVKNVEYYLNYYFFKEKNLVTFQLEREKDNDFRRFHGYFKFDPVENDPEERVMVIYSVDVELGKYFPDFIKNYFAKKDMPKLIKNLRKLIEKPRKEPKS